MFIELPSYFLGFDVEWEMIFVFAECSCRHSPAIVLPLPRFDVVLEMIWVFVVWICK